MQSYHRVTAATLSSLHVLQAAGWAESLILPVQLVPDSLNSCLVLPEPQGGAPVNLRSSEFPRHVTFVHFWSLRSLPFFSLEGMFELCGHCSVTCTMVWAQCILWKYLPECWTNPTTQRPVFLDRMHHVFWLGLRVI